MVRIGCPYRCVYGFYSRYFGQHHSILVIGFPAGVIQNHEVSSVLLKCLVYNESRSQMEELLVPRQAQVLP